MIRVLVADDQQVVREGLALVLGLLDGVEVVGAAADGEEAVRLAGLEKPDVVLMDLRMPRMDGVEATRRLRDELPAVKVLVLTTFSDERSVVDALRAGARGFLTKDAGGAEIHDALRQVVEDQAVLSPAVQRHLLAPPDRLTPRETEVLVLIAEGLSNAEIATRLFISEGTVKTHVNRVLAKTGTRDRAQAVVYAYRRGLAG